MCTTCRKRLRGHPFRLRFRYIERKQISRQSRASRRWPVSSPQPTPSPSSWLDVGQVDDVNIATFTRHHLLDLESVRMVGKDLFILVEQVGPRPLILDFHRVHYLG